MGVITTLNNELAQKEKQRLKEENEKLKENNKAMVVLLKDELADYIIQDSDKAIAIKTFLQSIGEL